MSRKIKQPIAIVTIEFEDKECNCKVNKTLSFFEKDEWVYFRDPIIKVHYKAHYCEDYGTLNVYYDDGKYELLKTIEL